MCVQPALSLRWSERQSILLRGSGAPPGRRAGAQRRLPHVLRDAAAALRRRHRACRSGPMTDLADSAASTATTTTPAREPLLKVEGLTKHFPVRSGLWGKGSVVRA